MSCDGRTNRQRDRPTEWLMELWVRNLKHWRRCLRQRYIYSSTKAMLSTFLFPTTYSKIYLKRWGFVHPSVSLSVHRSVRGSVMHFFFKLRIQVNSSKFRPFRNDWLEYTALFPFEILTVVKVESARQSSIDRLLYIIQFRAVQKPVQCTPYRNYIRLRLGPCIKKKIKKIQFGKRFSNRRTQSFFQGHCFTYGKDDI